MNSGLEFAVYGEGAALAFPRPVLFETAELTWNSRPIQDAQLRRVTSS